MKTQLWKTNSFIENESLTFDYLKCWLAPFVIGDNRVLAIEKNAASLSAIGLLHNNIVDS